MSLQRSGQLAQMVLNGTHFARSPPGPIKLILEHGLLNQDDLRKFSNASRVRGQSLRSNNDSDLSAKSRPPV
jgi:hypothetical protein